jgi:hypothetical protein
MIATYLGHEMVVSYFHVFHDILMLNNIAGILARCLRVLSLNMMYFKLGFVFYSSEFVLLLIQLILDAPSRVVQMQGMPCRSLINVVF